MIDWPEFERALKEEIALSTTTKELDVLYRGSRALLDKAKTSYSLYYNYSLLDLFKKRKEEILKGVDHATAS